MCLVQATIEDLRSRELGASDVFQNEKNISNSRIRVKLKPVFKLMDAC
ncbi:hypothetical protein VCHA56P521_20370 [Vibrio chagasii]|nr:hypothetical protein VCHA34P112_110124 [Vibrio chagasii]CAH6828366.1 hypothetical protein VCHA34P126_160082 [Vibrio chagasii]CAH6895934.1 hypothetical protein VCHA43P275_100153 [Vibrio chagasii]CAH6907526.1 hypothetical protein VCHA43P277_110161 [Vibrio chagasii]CAH6911643.1 hypothetical protein VCHA36P168_30094 [Vibrio chagasii]